YTYFHIFGDSILISTPPVSCPAFAEPVVVPSALPVGSQTSPLPEVDRSGYGGEYAPDLPADPPPGNRANPGLYRASDARGPMDRPRRRDEPVRSTRANPGHRGIVLPQLGYAPHSEPWPTGTARPSQRNESAPAKDVLANLHGNSRAGYTACGPPQAPSEVHPPLREP